jgi:lysophospholipase L1-like esterase
MLGVDIVNRGISGDTSGGILQRFIDEDKKGNVVILQGGANDAMSYLLVKPPHWTIQMILNNFKEMAWVAKRRGIEPILMPLLPFDPEW